MAPPKLGLDQTPVELTALHARPPCSLSEPKVVAKVKSCSPFCAGHSGFQSPGLFHKKHFPRGLPAFRRCSLLLPQLRSRLLLACGASAAALFLLDLQSQPPRVRHKTRGDSGHPVIWPAPSRVHAGCRTTRSSTCAAPWGRFQTRPSHPSPSPPRAAPQRRRLLMLTSVAGCVSQPSPMAGA